MKKAVIYARYSSDKQNETSTIAQIQECEEYAEKHGLTVIDWFKDEGLSAKSEKLDKRTEYHRLLRGVEHGLFDVILVHKYNRIHRSVYEMMSLHHVLKERKIELIAIKDNFDHPLVQLIMWHMAEQFLEELAAETRKGMKVIANKGEHCGGYAPFGYDVVEKRYVINDWEAEYVRRIFECAFNKQGYKAILQEMEDIGIVGRRGKVIGQTQINSMLRNPKYVGDFFYTPEIIELTEEEKAKPKQERKESPKIKIENNHPAIIDRAMFDEVQKIMKKREQSGKKQSNHLCSGLVYCSCGAKMHAHRSERKGKEYMYYRCPDKCGMGTVLMDDVDGAATAYLRELLDENMQVDIKKALSEYISGEQDRVKAFEDGRKRNIAQKQSEYDNLMSNLKGSKLPSAIVTQYGLEMNDLLDEIESLKNAKPPKDNTVDFVKGWLDTLTNTPDEKAVRLLVERIDVKDKTAFSITSTLNAVGGKMYCGRRI